MEVIISAESAGNSQDMASLRSWLDGAGSSATWTLAPEEPGPGGHLGFGVAEICAIIGAVEGLPPLINHIRNWFSTRQDPKPVTLTITVDPASGDVTVTVPGRE